MSNTEIIIDCNRLKQNYLYYKNLTKKEVIPVVKSNGYGHGLFQVSKAFEQFGVKTLAVANVEEAIFLRNNHIRTQILVLNPVDPRDYHLCSINNITISISSFDQFEKLSHLSRYDSLSFHLKINTGLERLGINYDEAKLIKELMADTPNIKLTGIFSHLVNAQTKEEFVRKQLEEFERVVKEFDTQNLLIHLTSTHSLNLDSAITNAVRIGLGLYGLNEHDSEVTSPVMSMSTKIIASREINKGTTLGYNQDKAIQKDAYLYTIPIGYADGFLIKHNYLFFIDDLPFKPVAKYMNLTQFISKKKFDLNTEVEIIGPHQSLVDLARRSKISPYEAAVLINEEINRKAIY